jgi:arylsulfatase A-like enzyme
MTKDKANTIRNNGLTRRCFVGGIASTAAAVGLGRCDLLAKNTPFMKKADSSRPNVLLIVADQHKAEVMGNAGHPVVKTPRLDRLAHSGVRFDRAYCQNAICVPSRTSFMTGLYPRTTGCVDNPNKPPHHDRLFPLQQVFHRNDYRTGCFGKRHLPHIGELALGWDRSATTINPKMDPSDENYTDWVTQRGQLDAHKRDFGGSHDADLMSHITEVREENRTSTYATDKTLEFLKECKDQGKPFFCWTNYIFPHQPYTPLQKWIDMYPPEKTELPESVSEPLENLPPEMQSWRRNTKRPWNLAAAAKDHALYRRYVAYYYALTSEVDACVGRIMDGLDRLGLSDDTIVIYTSDHGDFVAAHGMVEKCALGHNVYEDTLRVPLIVAWPERFLESAVNKSLVELVDLYPTLMDLLDLKRPKDAPELPGKSLIPSLTENKATGRKYAISENWNQATVITECYKLGVWIDPGPIPKYKRRDNRKRFPDQLFDREKDPNEIHNVIDSPEYNKIQKRLREYFDDFTSKVAATGKNEIIKRQQTKQHAKS